MTGFFADAAVYGLVIVGVVDAARKTVGPKLDGIFVVALAVLVGIGLSFLDPHGSVREAVGRGILWAFMAIGGNTLAVKTAGRLTTEGNAVPVVPMMATKSSNSDRPGAA